MNNWIQRLDVHEGGLDGFTSGYLKMGFNVDENGIWYREWAPNAVKAFLFGDFSKIHLNS